MAARTTTQPRPGPADIGLPRAATDEVATLLHRYLGDLVVLAVKTRGFHWNVAGPHFHALHELFGEQYEALNGDADKVAERMRMLGRPVETGLGALAEAARLQDAKGAPGWQDMVGELRRDHEGVSRQLRKDIAACDRLDDQGTLDLLTGLLQRHEAAAWMLRAHLEPA